jgi:hypothetical protein
MQPIVPDARLRGPCRRVFSEETDHNAAADLLRELDLDELDLLRDPDLCELDLDVRVRLVARNNRPATDHNPLASSDAIFPWT